MSDALWLAFGLMLVGEGLLPFARPALWRTVMLNLAGMTDRQIRLGGLLALGLGCTVVMLAA
ncbi:DUF2065 domain-containing protein [Chitinilyticum litopenaei]|uniref:DUF2065 domain-containing protein n=1 Tax=Chitinilyticum litopenaei TaxID=1121276 RepID=UPI00048CBA2D|nr:DUF2065 domain-containing protein [Chitinilyticum litopenaei]